ncbi:murein transglycosylase A [Sphingomonas lutea]|uniref:peptidoglycan lytic exotransglycosylase n=1 Tax=Sphingomonas lutea TaxID=1045317 RepID=A0A7G9SG28_9SPHN|nr:murein transglycosylase A [Sphingomonas lutea]
MRLGLRGLGAASLLLFASACATAPPPPSPAPPAPAPAPVPLPPPAPAPEVFPPTDPNARTAREAGVTVAAPKLLTPEQASRALAAFRISCSTVTRREDRSGLTRPEDWRGVCAEAATLAPAYAPGFFFHRFDWVRVGGGQAFATGYYEPELAGSRTRGPGYEVPIYRTPPDLVRCTRADGQTGRGRIDPRTGQCVLYFTRAEIDDGALANRGLELAWAADPIDLFFLQIQGSGRLKLPDGGVMRLGYDNQNGREYVAIGRLLRERGLLPPGGAKMQDIIAWMKANPEQGRALMRENLSYVFFRELSGPPLGSLGLPVSERVTVAVDPLFVPYGAPAYLTVDRPEANGLWVAQDTGGAIKGANRFDTFWGAGADATRIAGGMSASGQALILLPKGVAARVPQR